MVRRLQVRLAAAEARVAAAERSAAIATETLKEAKEQHAQALKEAHLMERARRRMQVIEDDDVPILDGIPVARGSSKRKSPDIPPAPPPTKDGGRTPRFPSHLQLRTSCGHSLS